MNRETKHSTKEIQAEAIRYFEILYKNREVVSFEYQIWALDQYLKMFTDESNRDLFRPANLEEILEVLKSFSKDKCLGPDGWEFFMHFFDLMGHNILDIVEESRTTGKILGAINSTFLYLIPKSSNPTNFVDFRPISLYNILYKIISKLIIGWIKIILSLHIAGEKLDFEVTR